MDLQELLGCPVDVSPKKVCAPESENGCCERRFTYEKTSLADCTIS